MRVAVYLTPDHPEHGGGVDGDVAVAFRLGRIEEGVHNAPIGHAAVPLKDFVAGLVSEAKAEFPGCRVEVERLIDNGDGTAKWIPAAEFDPQVHRAQGAGVIASREVAVSTEQQSAGSPSGVIHGS